MDAKRHAENLFTALRTRTPIAPITDAEPRLTTEQAYDIQHAFAARLIADGERLVGMKVGRTSRAAQKKMGVTDPVYGHLTDRMLLVEGDPCRTADLIQPKIEGELVFCLKSDLRGPGVSVADVFSATAWVAPAIELVDSRIDGGKDKFDNGLADNCSGAGLLIGRCLTPVDRHDLRLLGMTLEKNGLLVASGTGAEVMGNPANSITWLADKLAARGQWLPAGSVVLTGAVVPPQPAAAGDVFTVSFYGMGALTLRFE